MTWSDSRQTTSDADRIVAVMETAQPPVVPAASAGGSPLGVTAAPFIRSGTAAVVDLARRADRLGYDSFWVAEVTGIEAFSVLGAASRAAPGVGLGTGVLAMQVRTPPLLAMAAASLQALAPDREVLLGVGVSSPVVACDWHGAGYPARPLAHMREFLALLRECLSGDTVTFTGDYYQVRKFRLGVELGDRKPKIVLGALGEGMLRLAGDRAGALAAVPDEMVDAIDVTGDEALVRDTISAYQRAGVDVPVVFPLTWGAAGQDGLESTLRAAMAWSAPAAHGT